MRVRVRGLDDVFTYPCTKADVREAFGDDLLHSASFGTHGDHYFNRRETAGEITGRVLLTLGVSTVPLPRERAPVPQVYLSIYRVRRTEWSVYLHWQVRETMRGAMRPWAEAMFARPKTAPSGHVQMLVELREGRLFTHERRSK